MRAGADLGFRHACLLLLHDRSDLLVGLPKERTATKNGEHSGMHGTGCSVTAYGPRQLYKLYTDQKPDRGTRGVPIIRGVVFFAGHAPPGGANEFT